MNKTNPMADFVVRAMIESHVKPAKRGRIGIGKGEASEVIRSMFAEETGSHPLDSGGEGGRNWERNMRHPKDEKPYITFDDEDFESVVVNTMKHLLKLVQNGYLERTEPCRSMERKMFKFVADDKGQKLNDVQVHCGDAASFIAEELRVPESTFNSYNAEEFNDQTLQGSIFELDGRQYVSLQVHQGADVRGGYTQPRVFQADDEALCVMGITEVTAYCNEGECSRPRASEYYTFSKDDSVKPVMKVLADGESRDGWAGLWPHCKYCESALEVQI